MPPHETPDRQATETTNDLPALPVTGEALLICQQGETVLAVGEISRSVVASGEDAAAVIQQAIDLFGGQGGCVRLVGGTYDIARPIELRSQIHLSGTGRGSRLRLASANDEGEVVRAENVDGWLLSHLIISAGEVGKGRAGIHGTTCGDSCIEHCTVVGFGENGILLEQACFLMTVRHCRVMGNGLANIRLADMQRGRGGDFVPISVHDCMIYGGGHGIDCENATVMNLTANTVYQCRGAAYNVRNNSCSVLINGCRSFQITGHAVVVDMAHEVNITGNIFCWHTEEGILVTGCRWGNISGNNVIDSGSYNPDAKDHSIRFSELGPLPYYDGIRMADCRGFSVAGNTIFNWPQGCQMGAAIREDEQSSHNTFTGNNFNYYRYGGLISGGQHSCSENNVGLGKDPYYSTRHYEWIQSFQPHITSDLIETML
jgi:hypothetical protein